MIVILEPSRQQCLPASFLFPLPERGKITPKVQKPANIKPFNLPWARRRQWDCTLLWHHQSKWILPSALNHTWLRGHLSNLDFEGFWQGSLCFSLIFLLPGLFTFLFYIPSPIQFLSSNNTLWLDYRDVGCCVENKLKLGGSPRQLLRAATCCPPNSQRPLYNCAAATSQQSCFVCILEQTQAHTKAGVQEEARVLSKAVALQTLPGV